MFAIYESTDLRIHEWDCRSEIPTFVNSYIRKFVDAVASTKKYPGGRARPGGEEGGDNLGDESYDARAAARRGAATTGTALTVFVILERDWVRAMLRAFTTKHFSSA